MIIAMGLFVLLVTGAFYTGAFIDALKSELNTATKILCCGALVTAYIGLIIAIVGTVMTL